MTGTLDGQTGLPVQPTLYQYDALDNLQQATQGTQTCTFTYDVLSAERQGSGTVQYEYDANSNLWHKTDARNITTTYVYDELNRVITRSYSDTTPAVTYSYDIASVPTRRDD